MHEESKLNENIKNTSYLRIFSLILAFIILCTIFLPKNSFAVADILPRLELEQIIEGDSKGKAKVEIEYELQPVDGSPLPNGSRGSYRFTLVGNQNFKLEEIDFSRPGKNVYMLKALEQKKGPEVNLDKSIKKVEVDIYNQGEGFKKIFIYRNEKGEKLESLTYRHVLKKQDRPDKKKPERNPKMGDINIFYYFGSLLLALIILAKIRREKKYSKRI